MSTDRMFLCSSESTKASNTSGENDVSAKEDRLDCSCAPRGRISYRFLYAILNSTAVSMHIVSLFAIIGCNFGKLNQLERDFVFVSPIVRLDWTNHALIEADSRTTICKEVENSPHFRATLPTAEPATGLFAPRRRYPDFMPNLYNFSNKAIIKYNMAGSELELNTMMMSFFLLSALFQLVHMYALLVWDNRLPRFMHYLEYSISSPLMAMVMADHWRLMLASSSSLQSRASARCFVA